MPAIPKDLESLLGKLTPEEQSAVARYAASLARSKAKRPTHEPRFDWEGCLADLKDKYTSVSLQHAISAWRVGEQ